MNDRTYRLEDIRRAQADWAAGHFSAEWDGWRELAQRGGIIFPPEGSRWDSWEDDEPSQRAILIRAIRETPELLERSIIGARSWGEVVKRLLRGRDDLRDDAVLRERDAEWERETHRIGAMQSLREIFGRMRDSVP